MLGVPDASAPISVSALALRQDAPSSAGPRTGPIAGGPKGRDPTDTRGSLWPLRLRPYLNHYHPLGPGNGMCPSCPTSMPQNHQEATSSSWKSVQSFGRCLRRGLGSRDGSGGDERAQRLQHALAPCHRLVVSKTGGTEVGRVSPVVSVGGKSVRGPLEQQDLMRI